MNRKAAEEALVRHYSHLLAAEPEQKFAFRKTFDNAVQLAGVKHLTTDPADPGTFYEAIQWPAKREEGPKKQTLTDDVVTAQGLLREAAWLAAGQHGFAALAGLPELAAIISHTALPVLQRYACSLEEYEAADAAKNADEYVKEQKDDLDTRKGPLLAHLNPHLRLCLLGEVAAGLLVPGQPLPPDTIEHAAALYAFVDAARDQLHNELGHQPTIYSKFPINSTSSSRSRGWSNSFSDSPLTKALAKLQVSKPASPKKATESDLAPHADLQLQPPPHLLLELLLLQLQDDEAGRRQFQQCYGLENEQMEGLSFVMAADESFAWMHQIAQQVQQVQQQQEPDDKHQQQQQQASHQSSCNGSTAAQPAAAAAGVWQLLGQMHQQRDSHPRTAELLQQLPAAPDAAGLAANLAQMLAQGSICQRDGSSALEQSTCRQVVQQLRVLGGGLVLQFVAAARAAGGPSWQQEVPLQAVVLFGALEQLQGMALAYLNRVDVVHAAAGVSSSARQQQQRQQQQQQQQHHPCDKLKANGDHAKAPIGAADDCDSSPPLEQQQQQQRQQTCADAVSSDDINSNSSSGDSDRSATESAAAAAAAADAQRCGSAALMRVVRKLQDLLQLLRQFREANAALNAAAEADPSAAAVAARDSLSVHPLRGLAACELFSAASPLLHMFPEPCGHGIWAPAVPAAAAAAVDAQAHTAPISSSDSSCAVKDGSSSSSSSSSSGLHSFERGALAALAGAGVLAQRTHVLLSDLHSDLAAGGLQEEIAAEVVHVMQLKQHWSNFKRSQQQQSAQQDLPQELQPLLEVCQQQGVDPPPELLLQLQEVRPAVLDLALRRWQQVAEAAGVDFQHSSSYLYGWNRRQHLAAPGESAIKEGKQALWQLYTGKAVEVAEPLSAWQESCSRQQKSAVLASLSSTPHAAGSSSSNSAGGTNDASDDGRFCSSCKLCQAELRRHQEQQEMEQQQQQQNSPGSSSSSSNDSTGAGPVDTADPFMWRRLVWGLLGRVKRSARRLYAAEKGMCPHADNAYMWSQIVTSLKLHLWSRSGDGSWLAQVLLVQDTLEGTMPSRPRSFFVRHFARAANLAFAQGYTSPAAALLSHQVLLALSPLHQQQLPQPELAALLPSSFGPVVGKVLQQQLGLGGVLQEFQHESAGQPLMWHVWWHIGVRRYHWVKQQQQQQQHGQQQEGQGQASCSSRSAAARAAAAAAAGGNQGLSRLSAAELEALYKDPAAKYYAVGFAARQLCPDVTWLKPAAASSNRRHLTLLEGLASQLLAACKLSYTRILHGTRSDCEAGSSHSAAVAAAVADAVCAVQHDDALVCVSMANALCKGAVSSNNRKEAWDSLNDLDLDLDDLDLGSSRRENPIEKSSIANMITQQQTMQATICGDLKNAGGVREVLCCALGAAERSSGTVQAALLVPAPVELWVAPAQWCAKRAALAREHLCSQCEEQPLKVLWQLLMPIGWRSEEEGLRAGDSYCDGCGAFQFCDKKCAAKCWRWHESLCKPLSEVRKRYQRQPAPKCSQPGLLRCTTCTADSSSSDSSSDGSSSGSSENDDAGYLWMEQCSSSSGLQWPVLQLLQQGSRHSWGEQCIVDEPGPLGLNCCGLMDSHHVHDASLVQTPHAAWRALKHAESVRHDAMRCKALRMATQLAGLAEEQRWGIGDY